MDLEEASMENLANALFRIDKKDIPVYYDENTEKLTVYFDSNGVSLPEDLDKLIVKKLGLLTDGLVLYKLCVPLFNIRCSASTVRDFMKKV